MRAAENIRTLATLDVDWMGMIFFEKSARNVTQPVSAAVNLPKVGVFVNEKEEVIFSKIKTYALAALQLHGEETPEFCASLKRKLGENIMLIKVFSVGETFNFQEVKPYEGVCDYFLFDTKGKLRGGNGRTFDWDILRNYTGNTPFLLSGGIGMAHLAALKTFQHPQLAGIDLNSQFEKSPAVKDIQQLKTFINELRNQ